jgi:uncharacterized membrane protein HdeD (DUF308 family)
MADHITDSWVRSVRVLYLFRAGFSVAWVALVSALASSAAPGGTPGVLAGILLVCYPVSDAVATVFDLRALRPARSGWPQQVNLVAGVAAAGGILIALLTSLATAITVFGVWAIVSGAVMAVLAGRRRWALGGQWLMIISGAGSIVAGITFIGWTGTSRTGLAVLAQYSAGGALWYLLAGLWLQRSARPSAAVAGGAGVEDNGPRSSLNLVSRFREGSFTELGPTTSAAHQRALNIVNVDCSGPARRIPAVAAGSTAGVR